MFCALCEPLIGIGLQYIYINGYVNRYNYVYIYTWGPILYGDMILETSRVISGHPFCHLLQRYQIPVGYGSKA